MSTRPHISAATLLAHRRGAVALKAFLALVALTGLGTGGAMLFRSADPPSGEANTDSIRSDIAAAAEQSFDITTVGQGELEARKQIEIRNKLEFETAIVEIIAEGTNVKAGDVVIRLNTDTVQTQIDQELLGIETAKADLASALSAYDIQVNENDSTLRKAKLAVDLADLDLRQWEQGEVKSKRLKNLLDKDAADSELKRLQDKVAQSESLAKSGFISKDELLKDHLELRKAEAAIQTADLNIDVYENFQYPKERKTKESALEEAKAELERVIQKNDRQLTSRDADRVNKRQQLALREQRLAKLREQLAEGTQRAPADGLVVYSTTLQRNFWSSDRGPLQVGRKVYPNQLLIVLPDTTEMIASTKVPESIAGKIKPGQHASIKIDAIGGRSVVGSVESVGILAEANNWDDPNLREYTVKIKLDPAASTLAIRPSMRCDAEILLERVEKALSVPIQSIFSEGAVRYAYVPSGSRYIRRPVKIGRRSDRFAEILSGLPAGQTVLLREPKSGESITRPWDKAELAAVGLEFNAKGDVVPHADAAQGVATAAATMPVPAPAPAAVSAPEIK